MHAKSLQSCPTLCDPIDCSPPGSSVYGILQAGILEWVAMPSFRGSSPPRVEPRSPTLQVDSLPAELPGKPILGITLCNMPPKPLTLLLPLYKDSNSDLNIQTASIGDWNKD